MLRLSREYVIQQLETLADDGVSRIGQSEWSIRGIDCRRERHGYRGQHYCFDLDILTLRAGPEDGRWELHIVTEYWRSGDGKSMHNPKWLKLVSGKALDVTKWLQKHRDDLSNSSTANPPASMNR